MFFSIKDFAVLIVSGQFWGSPGPYDCKFVFEELKNLMEEEKAAKK